MVQAETPRRCAASLTETAIGSMPITLVWFVWFALTRTPLVWCGVADYGTTVGQGVDETPKLRQSLPKAVARESAAASGWTNLAYPLGGRVLVTSERPRGVTVAPVAEEMTRGAQIRARRERMSWSARAFATRAGFNRGTLTDVETDAPTVRETSYAAAERTLDELEEELGYDKPGDHVVRFVVRGVYGAEALVVEGPVEDIAALEASVDRIMRGLRGSERDT